MPPYGEIFSRFYDNRFGGYAEKLAPALLGLFASSPAVTAHPQALDLGCGTGRLALRFLEAGYSVVGLDLSAPMLELAGKRCARFVVNGQARFVQADISQFTLEESFGAVLSTYNSLNHLDSEEKLKGCFDSAKACLSDQGILVFDYHTRRGLGEWASSESGEFEEGKIEISGSFDPRLNRASMRLTGLFRGEPFEEIVFNWALPLEGVADLLKRAGFSRVDFFGMDDLKRPIQEPELENRVVVIAG